MVRKFYDVTPEGGAGGTETAEVVTPTNSIAALMASKGVRNETGDMVATPIQITTETKEETTTEKPAGAASATEVVNVEKASETPSPEPEPTPVPTPQKAEEQQVVPTWQEVLKSQQPNNVLKELGFDDNLISLVSGLKDADPKMVSFFNHWKEGGDVTQYLQELTTDYGKMPAEDIMRNQLKREYPKASAAQLEILYKTKIVEQFKLDPEKFSEAEIEEGRLLLEAEADKYRDVFTTKQQEFILPKAPKKSEPQPDPKEQERVKAFEDVQRQIKESAYTKNIFTNKAFTLGEGEEKFTFPVNPEELLDVTLNGDKDGSLLFEIGKTADGREVVKPRTEHQLLVATVQKYGMPFIESLAKHYKSIGAKVVEQIDNASQPGHTNQGTPAEAQPKTVAEAMAREGKYNPGGR